MVLHPVGGDVAPSDVSVSGGRSMPLSRSKSELAQEGRLSMGSGELLHCPGCSNVKNDTPVYVCTACGYKGCADCWAGSQCPRCDTRSRSLVGRIKGLD